MAHHDRNGRPRLQPRALGIGLAGALLTELMLAGWIGLRRDSAVVIVPGVAQGTVLRHALLKQVADEPGPQPVQAWLRFLARSAARDVALRLEQAGYLGHVRSWIPWRQVRWVPVNRTGRSRRCSGSGPLWTPRVRLPLMGQPWPGWRSRAGSASCWTSTTPGPAGLSRTRSPQSAPACRS
jgi:hypothetical protein